VKAGYFITASGEKKYIGLISDENLDLVCMMTKTICISSKLGAYFIDRKALSQ
jgi:hypothetical protein